MRIALEDSPSQSLNEAGFPAYAHRNFFFSNPFWRRIEHITGHLKDKSFPVVLDFGCGDGVMLPFLSNIAGKVIAADKDLKPLQQVGSCMPLGDKLEIFDLTKKSLDDIESSSIDLILALDVLEHVDNLVSTLKMLMRLLAPGGQIIVSGPTENLYYRVGRKFAGEEFSGDYHMRDIYEIEEELSGLINASKLVTIKYPFPIFDIVFGKKANSV